MEPKTLLAEGIGDDVRRRQQQRVCTFTRVVRHQCNAVMLRQYRRDIVVTDKRNIARNNQRCAGTVLADHMQAGLGQCL